jgi:hypothetical protein
VMIDRRIRNAFIRVSLCRSPWHRTMATNPVHVGLRHDKFATQLGS